MRGVAMGLDRQGPLNVGNNMKSRNDLTLWNIIERLQRRLERDGVSPANTDKAVALAIRQLAVGR
jgi:hypothetical protein